MDITKTDLNLIIKHTTVSDWETVAKKKHYSLITVKNILYAQSEINERNSIIVTSLLYKALVNIDKDLESVNELKNKLK